MVTGVPAPVLALEAGMTWTTSGAAAVDGVGSVLGVRVSVRESAGSSWFMKIWVYWPVLVSASPICAVWVPVVVQGPRMFSRWPQHPPAPADVQWRFVPPYPSLYIQA